jgi:hypothetical protein
MVVKIHISRDENPWAEDAVVYTEEEDYNEEASLKETVDRMRKEYGKAFCILIEVPQVG